MLHQYDNMLAFNSFTDVFFIQDDPFFFDVLTLFAEIWDPIK